MANVIVIKKGAGVPSPDSLQEAELALDVTDGALYSKLQDGTIHHLNDGADDVDLSDYVTEAPIDTKQYVRQDGSWSEIVIPDGGTGSSVHIGENPPADPQEGQQWMEVPADGDAIMWIWDGAVWLQQPGGKDGADGADGSGSSVHIGDTPPPNPHEGQLWQSSKSGDEGLYCWDGSVWFEVSGANGADGADGNIQDGADDGSQDGIIATWDSSYDQWRANTAVTVNASGNATFGGAVNAPLLYLARESKQLAFNPNVGLGNSSALIQSDTGMELHLAANKQGAHLRIAENGDATFSGTVTVNAATVWDAGIYRASGNIANGGNGIYFNGNGVLPANSGGTADTTAKFDLGSSSYRWKNVYGTTARMDVFIQDGSPVVDAKGLINTLSTLRNATKDETTLEGMRDALSDAIGGLIENLEHEISTMPSPEPEVSTMEEAE
jgi:hypothetical protein